MAVGKYLPQAVRAGAHGCWGSPHDLCSEFMSALVVLERMSVAVIIPTFNHTRFLADAISSVLAQTRHADEIIVVDDGSTDDPAAVVEDFPGVRLIRQRNRGLSAARNVGFRNCTTSHVL